MNAGGGSSQFGGRPQLTPLADSKVETQTARVRTSSTPPSRLLAPGSRLCYRPNALARDPKLTESAGSCIHEQAGLRPGPTSDREAAAFRPKAAVCGAATYTVSSRCRAARLEPPSTRGSP